MLSRVDVRSPKRITKAMGAWISLPGFPRPCAIGTSASPVAMAVMKIGASRSEVPNITARREVSHALCLNQMPDMRNEHDPISCGDAE
jgi:hypothetical protein